jgi:hypothetical protein
MAQVRRLERPQVAVRPIPGAGAQVIRQALQRGVKRPIGKGKALAENTSSRTCCGLRKRRRRRYAAEFSS